MKTNLKIIYLGIAAIITITPFLSSASNAETEIKLFLVKKPILENVLDILNYAQGNIRGENIQNYNLQRKTKFDLLDSESKTIKIYPYSGMISFSLKEQRYKIHPDENISSLQNNINQAIRAAHQFLNDNVRLNVSVYDEVFVYDIQQIKHKSTAFGSLRERVSVGNAIVVFGRKINGYRVVGDGNFARIFIRPDMEVVAYEYQWDGIELIGQAFTIDKEAINRINNYKDSELVYICSDRYSEKRELIPAYIGQKWESSQLEIRHAITQERISLEKAR